jgi:hypothetical protein
MPSRSLPKPPHLILAIRTNWAHITKLCLTWDVLRAGQL